MTYSPAFPAGITVTHLVPARTGTDRRGNEIITWTGHPVSSCVFVPQAETEATSGTEQVTSLAELYVPVDEPAGFLDRWQMPDGSLYEQTGNSSAWKSPWSGISSPKMLHLKMVTGAGAHAPVESGGQ